MAAISELVDPSALVVDVGSDHALLGIALVRSGKAGFVANVDVRPGPLAAGRRNVERAGLQNSFAHFLSDGFDGFDGPLDGATVVVAGMGGRTIARIVQNMPDGWRALVAQPETGAHLVRAWARAKGYGIAAERVVKSRRCHELFKVVPRGGHCVKTAADELFGPEAARTAGSKDAFRELWSGRLLRFRLAAAAGNALAAERSALIAKELARDA